MKSLTGKYASVTGIALVLWIATGFVRSLGDERKARKEAMLSELSAILAPKQEIGVPYVTFPYVEITRDDKGKEIARSTQHIYINAVDAEFTGESLVTERARGIYKARVYDLDLVIQAKFKFPNVNGNPSADLAQTVKGREIQYLRPYVFFPIGAKKALKEIPTLNVEGLKEAIVGKACANGICYDLGLDHREIQDKLKSLHSNLKLSGLETFRIQTAAGGTRVTLKSNWPSPSFSGENIPSTHKITDQGFTAEWNVLKTGGDSEFTSFDVAFVDPVDVYTLTDRAAKHSILFITCVFVGFFAVEVFRRIRLHTLNYTLVGASLVVFYLIVLSLSEHISFAWAYFISTITSVSLIRTYLGGVLPNKFDANVFTVSLTTLYGMLFVILSAEDFALLFGSFLVFSLLAGTMIITRKMDWFQIEKEISTKGGAGSPTV